MYTVNVIYLFFQDGAHTAAVEVILFNILYLSTCALQVFACIMYMYFIIEL